MSSKISTCWINVTSGCNNKCLFCYYKDKTNKYMSLKDIKKYAKLLKELNIKNLILIGGEPTIHPKILTITKNLTQKFGLRPAIITNGKKLADKKFARELMKYAKAITISIEGTEKIHNQLTGTKSFSLTLKGLKNCIKIDKKRVGTNMTISRQNIENISALIDLLYGLGIRKITSNMCTDFEPAEAALSPTEFAKLTEKIFRKKRKEHPDISIKMITPQPLCLYDKNMRKIYAGGCHIFNGSGLVIDVDGSILLCTHWIKYPLIKLSPKTKATEFNKIWKRLEKYRKEIRRYPSKKCVSCELWDQCVGGCPILWRVFDASKEIPGISD